MPPSPAIDRSRRAFTLVELLTATTILSILVIVLGQMASLATSSWTNVQGQTERRQTARAVADYISADIAATLLPLEPTSTSSFVLNPDLADEGLFHPSAVFCLSPIATERIAGDVAEVGYFVRWDTSNPKNPRARLCRYFVNPSDPNYTADQAPLNWVSNIDSVAPADKNNDYKGLFAEDVVGLWIRCLSPETNPNGSHEELAGPGESFDSTKGYDYVDPATGEMKRKHLPAAVEVSLVMLDSRSASRIGPDEMNAIVSLAKSADNATDLVEDALENDALKGISAGMRTFTTTVYLVNSK